MHNAKKKGNTYCCVPHCRNYNRNGLSFHTFPTDTKLRKCWETVLGLEKPSSNFMRVCSEHFTAFDYFPGPSKCKRRLKQNVIPSKKLPVRQPAIERQSCINQRSERAQRRNDFSVSVDDIRKNGFEVENHTREEELDSQRPRSSTDCTDAASENPVETDAVTRTDNDELALFITQPGESMCRTLVPHTAAREINEESDVHNTCIRLKTESTDNTELFGSNGVASVYIKTEDVSEDEDKFGSDCIKKSPCSDEEKYCGAPRFKVKEEYDWDGSVKTEPDRKVKSEHGYGSESSSSDRAHRNDLADDKNVQLYWMLQETINIKEEPEDVPEEDTGSEWNVFES